MFQLLSVQPGCINKQIEISLFSVLPIFRLNEIVEKLHDSLLLINKQR